MAADGVIVGLVSVADAVKPTSGQAITELRGLGLRPVLLTGDHEAAARSVAAEVGIDDVIAGVLPEEKVATVERLQESGAIVVMVGDGVNDAAALAQVRYGVALGPDSLTQISSNRYAASTLGTVDRPTSGPDCDRP